MNFIIRIPDINPNNHICVLISTLGGRFPRAADEPSQAIALRGLI